MNRTVTQDGTERVTGRTCLHSLREIRVLQVTRSSHRQPNPLWAFLGDKGRMKRLRCWPFENVTSKESWGHVHESVFIQSWFTELTDVISCTQFKAPENESSCLSSKRPRFFHCRLHPSAGTLLRARQRHLQSIGDFSV